MENIATQIKGLKEERAGKITGMDGLVEKMSTEKRSLTPEEKIQYDGFKAAVESIDERMAILLDAEKRALATAKPTGYAGAGSDDGDTGETERREKQKMYNKWTWKRALQIGTVRGARRDGVEAELDQIERQEMLECGVSEMSNESILAPAQVFLSLIHI